MLVSHNPLRTLDAQTDKAQTRGCARAAAATGLAGPMTAAAREQSIRLPEPIAADIAAGRVFASRADAPSKGATVRGPRTVATPIPSRWRGPLPDPEIEHVLPIKDGYAMVPLSLLHGGYPDLGVLIWAQLRLKAVRGGAVTTSYVELAQELGVDSDSSDSVKVKVSLAVKPLLGSWIQRRSMGNNTYAYEAMLLDPSERYAMIRRYDIRLIGSSRESRVPVKPADVVDFARWQLECGQRGWTAESTGAIAKRWQVTPPTIRASRSRLSALGLLKVVPREGRLSDLVWLEEAFDPHWSVPSAPDTVATEAPLRIIRPNSPEECSNKNHLPDQEEVDNQNGKKPITPIEDLTGPLSEDDLSDLVGTSVPTLTSSTRETADAPPPASRMEDHRRAKEPNLHQVSAQLINRQPVLASAPPHFRRAMVKRLAAALASGLDQHHVERALARVVVQGDFDAECLLLKQALEQARIDQRVGMCAECGGAAEGHPASCSASKQVSDSSGDKELGQLLRMANRKNVSADPLATILQQPVRDPGGLVEDAEVMDWMIVQLAHQIAGSSDRQATLQRIQTSWRRQMGPAKQDLVDRAAEYVRYALTRSLAS